MIDERREMPDADPNRTYVALRMGFWLMFYSLVLVSAGLGTAIAVLTVYRIGNPEFWSGKPWPWVLLALSASAFIAIAAFSGRLIITWAQLLRYARYQEFRARTVIAAKDITAYTENEEKRNQALTDKVGEMGSRIQETVKAEVRTETKNSENTMKAALDELSKELTVLVTGLYERVNSLEARTPSYALTEGAIASSTEMRREETAEPDEAEEDTENPEASVEAVKEEEIPDEEKKSIGDEDNDREEETTTRIWADSPDEGGVRPEFMDEDIEEDAEETKQNTRPIPISSLLDEDDDEIPGDED